MTKPIVRDQLQSEIKRIQRDLGVTVLYVTHDQEEALALSDRIAVMADGKICQLATPDELYERPKTAFVAGFVGESNFVPVTLGAADGGLRRLAATLAPGLTFIAKDTSSLNSPSAVMMMRPEVITLSANAEAGNANFVPGRIELREFLGATVRFTVATGLGSLVVRHGGSVRVRVCSLVMQLGCLGRQKMRSSFRLRLDDAGQNLVLGSEVPLKFDEQGRLTPRCPSVSNRTSTAIWSAQAFGRAGTRIVHDRGPTVITFTVASGPTSQCETSSGRT